MKMIRVLKMEFRKLVDLYIMVVSFVINIVNKTA